jgi:penicillin-binding protein 1C
VSTSFRLHLDADPTPTPGSAMPDPAPPSGLSPTDRTAVGSSRSARVLRAGAVVVLLPVVLLVHVTIVMLMAWPFSRTELLAASEPLVVLDRRGELIATVPAATADRNQWTPMADLPAIAASAVIESEDHGFWRHRGVDGLGLARAVWLNLQTGKLGFGGSTLTMQVARMLISQGAPRSLGAKVREAMMALRLERALDKHAILEQWLDRAYFGNGAYGYAAAAQLYFGKSANALSVGEAVLLAVLPRAPSGYDPLVHREAALRRRDYVLDLLRSRGLLSPAAIADAKAQPLTIGRHRAPNRAPHFVAWVVDQLSNEERQRGGTVRTTLDLRLQEVLVRRVAQQVAELGTRNLQQAGLVVLETASSAVLAMVGSVDFDAAAAPDSGSQINITTRRRNPGSALKPFVYAAAIERGASPVSLAWDLRDAQDEFFAPHGGVEHGPTRYREALASSYNFAAVDVLHEVGIATVMTALSQAGVAALPGTPDDYGLRLALGAAKVRLIDLTAGYGFLVRGGKARAAHGLDAMIAPSGAVVRPKAALDRTVFSPATSWLVMDMLADPEARRPGFGTELPFDLPFRIAAKTGTARGFADTWAVGATEQVIVGAWAGTFDGTPTQGLVGMDAAAVLVRDAYLTLAETSRPTLPPRPAGIEEVDVCPISGMLPGPHCPHLHDYVPAGKAPTATCDWHRGSGPIAYPPRAQAWLKRNRGR